MSFKKITIGFSRPKNKWFPFFSWAIRALYCTKYSHVYVRWMGAGNSTDIVYEASGTAVKFLAGRIFNEKAEVIHAYSIDVNKETYIKLLQFCMGNAGVSYGVWQAIGMGLQQIFKLKSNPFPNGREKQVCSELIANIIEDVIQIDTGINSDLASPPDIKRILDSNADVFTKIK